MRQAFELTTSWTVRLGTTAVSLIVGLSLGTFFVWFWSSLSTGALIALFLLGLSLALVGGSLYEANQVNGRLRWDLLFTGQILGAIGGMLFFFASVL